MRALVCRFALVYMFRPAQSTVPPEPSECRHEDKRPPGMTRLQCVDQAYANITNQCVRPFMQVRGWVCDWAGGRAAWHAISQSASQPPVSHAGARDGQLSL